MKDFIEINVRWNSIEVTRLQELGIDTEGAHTFKTIEVRKSAISYIYEYENMCVIAFSPMDYDELITDVPFKDRAIFY